MGYAAKKGKLQTSRTDLLYVLKSISFYNLKARAAGLNEEATDRFVLDSFFATLTNTNFDKKEIESLIKKGFELRDEIKAKLPAEMIAAEKDLPAVATVTPENIESLDVAVHSTAGRGYQVTQGTSDLWLEGDGCLCSSCLCSRI